MKGFIESLINRFNGAENTITPRLSGRFEPAFTDRLNQFVESTSEYETTQVSNATNNVSSLRDPEPRFFDNKYSGDQLSKDQSTYYSPIEKQKATVVNPVDNELSSNSQQQENNTIIKAFIQPSGFCDGNQLGSQIETEQRNEFKETSASDIGDNPMNFVFLDRQIEKEKQIGKIETTQNLPIRPEQYATIRNEISYPDFHEHSQSNQTPVIKISIGRIEVRAVPVSNGIKVKNSSPQKPRLTLDEYLQKRNNRQ